MSIHQQQEVAFSIMRWSLSCPALPFLAAFPLCKVVLYTVVTCVNAAIRKLKWMKHLFNEAGPLGNLPSSGNMGGVRNLMILLPAFFIFHLREADCVPRMLLSWFTPVVLVKPELCLLPIVLALPLRKTSSPAYFTDSARVCEAEVYRNERTLISREYLKPLSAGLQEETIKLLCPFKNHTPS